MFEDEDLLSLELLFELDHDSLGKLGINTGTRIKIIKGLEKLRKADWEIKVPLFHDELSFLALSTSRS